MGVLWEWQVQKINFLVLKHKMDHGSWHRGVGTLKLSLPLSYLISSDVQVPIQRHHSVWS